MGLGAALAVLSSVRDADGYNLYNNAPPAAFAVLERAATTTGDCAAHLDLLQLISAADLPRDADVATEAQRAEDACPNDPTPGWLLGQFQSLRAVQTDALGLPVSVPEGTAAAAKATFDELVERFPRSATVLSGAGDARVREGERIAGERPFTAREEFQAAAAYYRDALELSPTAEISAGLARALVGLGEPGKAVEVLQDAAAATTPGFRMELLTAAQEWAHDFTGAQETGQEHAQLGPSGYPQGNALFATPQSGASFDGDELTIPVVSWGIDRFAPLEVPLEYYEGGGGASVDDVSFVPRYRPDAPWTGPNTRCPDWGWIRDAVLAGNADDALDGMARGELREVRPYDAYACPFFPHPPRNLIRLELGETVDVRPGILEKLYDRRQNMWRWAGDLDRAADVAEDWTKDADGSRWESLPAQRLAEIRYLQGRYAEAASEFGAASRAIRRAHWDDELGHQRAELARASALLHADRRAEALDLLGTLAPDAEFSAAYHLQNGTQYDVEFAGVAYHARTILADAQLEDSEVDAALESYRAAEEQLATLDDQYSPVVGYRPERLYNNLALARLAAGQETDAADAVERALDVDPMNPAFLMTAGFVADRRGDREKAIDYNRRALESDPGAYPAANDLGVQLARDGNNDAAVDALQQAVTANPDYALGWFNLGVVHGRMGPAHLPASQGSFARAARLDPDLADRRPDLTIDATIYRTGLDLSKPLPPGWSFGGLRPAAPAVSVGLIAVLALALAVARSVGTSGQDFASRWAESVDHHMQKVPLVRHLRAPAWGLGLTVLLLWSSVLRQGWSQAWVLLAAAVALAVIAGAALRARTAVARPTRSTAQRSWPPGMVVGVAATVAGAPWAPLPVLDDTDRPSTRVHVAAPLVLLAIATILLVEAAWLRVPLTRAMAVAALIMAASTLLPIGPLDGARLRKGQLVAGAGAAFALALAVLGLG
ncbi:tetratricopeptide repeat protein [Nocardioides sp. CGMCC 1.13656]|uniref:tetratricopeptide repeat protein n=1 Tax=Nocardioides TaxID=1839 RepID=UPI0015ECB268|nr:tetratricopeptide repeat protein [Nocardioides sp. CGMCC 1.13656]MBA2955888.1 tetratricopeptide repeat protein [Nocardioides sp. CGMCC 1.13656]